MNETELRTMIRESDSKPLRICMDDGKAFQISHPDFAMVAEGALILGSGPGHELGGASFVVCYFDHISRIEQLKKRRKSEKRGQ